MKTVEIKVYSFSELSEEAKQVAIDYFSDINVDHNWWEWTYMDAEEIGLKITSFDLGRRREIEGQFELSACEVAQNILNNHGENTSTYKTANEFMRNWQPVYDKYLEEEGYELEEELMDIENDFLSDLLQDYYQLLEREYEYRTSEEAIIERIESNEYEFTEYGKLF